MIVMLNSKFYPPTGRTIFQLFYFNS